MVRFAQDTPQDTEAAKQIWSECFEDSPRFVDWNFRENYIPSDTLLYVKDGMPVSHLQFHPYTIAMKGRAVQAGYLSGVATLPAFRGRGYSSALIHSALKALLDRNISYCFLIPVSFSFYEQFGFAACCDKITRLLPPEEWPAAPASVPWEDAGTDSGPLLHGAYRNALSSCNGYVLRSERDWKIFLSDNLLNAKAVCRFVRRGEECGYFLARHTENRTKLFVIEAGYTSSALKEEVLRQIILQGGDKRTVELIDLPEGGLLAGGNVPASSRPYAMGRILNVTEALRLCAEEFSGSVRIAVSDPILAENNGVFAVKHSSVSRSGDVPDLTTDIGTLSAMVWGYLDPLSAGASSLLQGDIRKAEGLFRKENNYLDNSILAF